MATGPVDVSILNQTVGYILIGLTFELLLYGVSLAQTAHYYHEYPSDRFFIRALFLWAYLVGSHGDLAGVTQSTNSAIFKAEYCLAVRGSVFPLFYVDAHPIFMYALTGIHQFNHTILTTLLKVVMANKWPRVVLTTSMVLFALLSFLTDESNMVLGSTLDTAHAANVDSIHIPGSIQTVTAVVTDVYIAIALTIILRRKRTGFHATDSLITMLVSFAIQRGVLTALMQFLHFATYIGTFKAGAAKLIWALFYFPGGKIYTNSFLAVLNIRHWLREAPATGWRIEDIELSASKSGN
ncbi:hypothetical protein FOMPIDRAFT_114925 [Fomitopsis schrenkii]|uniref:DUF6534 domain-containing protein n=1 Tax=Fomitopsis schrenkii TaxID=2126942 RepID=S8DJJ4_FOMSC|nr:hypothetical protein FOMPIDRAFT_114925 [Fomitopsis schrenkii]